jgi:nucleoside-diphosphate-sugar epimerase
VRVDPALIRPAEVDTLLADPRKAKAELGWTARTSFRALIELMVEADLEHQERTTGARRDRGGRVEPPERVLVTGAAGFIGSTLCERLLAEGRSVIGLDNFDPFYPESHKQANLAAARRSDRFSLVRADLRDADAVRGIFAGTAIDAVVHLAALAGVRPSLERPSEYADVNVRGSSCCSRPPCARARRAWCSRRRRRCRRAQATGRSASRIRSSGRSRPTPRPSARAS